MKNIHTDSHKENEDEFNRKPYAKQIAHNLLHFYKNGSESIVVGINGEWGSGKSCLLHFIREEIETQKKENKSNEKHLIFEFNPWHFAGQEQLQRKFFEELKSKMSVWSKLLENVKEGSENTSKFLEKLQEGVNYVGELGNKFGNQLDNLKGLAGIIAPFVGTEVVSGLAKLLKNEEEKVKPLEEIKEKINELIKDSELKIFIFIDDLDRLPPADIAQIFQLVRLNANFKNTVFFLAYDKEIVVNALSKEYGKNGERYLEKIVTVDYSILKVPSLTLKDIFLKRLRSFLTNYENIEIEEVLKNIDEFWYKGLSEYFTTMRDMVRFENALLMRFGSIYEEVDVTDFIVIEAIRLFDNEAYETIYFYKELLFGLTIHNGNKIEKTIDFEKIKQTFNFKNNTIELIKALFRLQDFNNSMNPFKKLSFDENFNRDNKKSISESKYFDIYFTFNEINRGSSKIFLNKFLQDNDIEKVKTLIDLNTSSNSDFFDFSKMLELIISNNSDKENCNLLSIIIKFGKIINQFGQNFRTAYLLCTELGEKLNSNPNTFIDILSKEEDNNFLKLYILSKIMFLFEELDKNQGYTSSFYKILNYNEITNEEYRKRFKDAYLKCLQVVGDDVFENHKNYNQKAIKYIFREYEISFPEYFEAKILQFIKDDTKFLIYIIYILEENVEFEVLSLQESKLPSFFPKEKLIERFDEIKVENITEYVDKMNYRFIKHIIDNDGFGKYFNFYTLKEDNPFE